MSDTPRTDRHSLDMETEDFDVELAKTYELAWQLERELNDAKAALSGRTVSCSNCNELARENEEMRETLVMAADYLQVFSPDNPRGKLAKLKRRLKPYLK